MVDKWTIGSNNEGLYNGVKPPEEGDHERKRKNMKEEPTARTLLEVTNSSNTCSSDLRSSLACVFYSPRPNS